jgi:1-acyl-sn-glycerol-3-phosphate acyltransferase
VGLICWAYEFPLVRRYTKNELQERPERKGKDRQTLRTTLNQFHDTPGSIVNFAEGTRFSPEKAKRFCSHYRFLLNPKTGGLLIILQSLGEQLYQILDLTLAYDCPKFHFWDFLCGKCRRVIVQAKHITPDYALGRPKEDLRNLTQHDVSQWIQQVWEEKDQLTLTLRSELNQDRLDRYARQPDEIRGSQEVMNRTEP